MNVTKLSIIIFEAYMRAQSRDDIVPTLAELKTESQKLFNDIKQQNHRLYVLETAKLLELVTQSCSWLYDMYSLPEKLSREAESNLYKSSTQLMGYLTYEHSLPESIWRFCVCFGCWLKYIVFLRNNVNITEQMVLIKKSLETSLCFTKIFFPYLLTEEEILKIDNIEEREMYKKYDFDVQTILLQEAKEELISAIIKRLGI